MPCFAVAAIDSMPMPCLPAPRGPVGEKDAATATSKHGSLYGFSCRRASWSVNPSVCMVTVSPRSRRMIASRHCSMRGRCSSAGIPSMCASDVSWPGPQPSIARPRVRWSSSTMRSASINGWWYGSELDAGAELDVLGPLRGDGDEDLGRCDDLEPGGVVLADPGLVEPEAVHRHDQVEVSLDRECRVLPDRVEGGHEVSEAHSPILTSTPHFSGLLG